jgi:hypothetical protein
MRKSFATHALLFLISTILARKSNAINTFLISAIHRFHETKTHRPRLQTISNRPIGSIQRLQRRCLVSPVVLASCQVPSRPRARRGVHPPIGAGRRDRKLAVSVTRTCHAWGFTLQMACSGHMPKPSVGFHNSPAPRLGNKHGRRFFQNFLIFLPAPD